MILTKINLFSKIVTKIGIFYFRKLDYDWEALNNVTVISIIQKHFQTFFRILNRALSKTLTKIEIFLKV